MLDLSKQCNPQINEKKFKHKLNQNLIQSTLHKRLLETKIPIPT